MKKIIFFYSSDPVELMSKITYLWLLFSCLLVGVLFSEGDRQDTAGAMNFTKSGERYFKEGNYDSSLIYFRKAGILWIALGDTQKFLESQVGISNNLLRKGEYGKTTEVLSKAVEIGKRCSSVTELGTMYSLLGYCYYSLEKMVDAEHFAVQGADLNVKTFGEINAKVASSYYTLGLVYRTIGDYDKAIQCLKRTEKVQIELFGDQYYFLSNIYTLIGASHDGRNEFDDAIRYFQKALAIFNKANRSQSADAGLCYVQMMSSHNNKGDYRTAIEYGKKAEEIYSSPSHQDDINGASMYGKLGEIYTTLGDYEKAKEYLLRSLMLFTSKYPHKKSGIGALHQLLGDLYKRTGDIKNAVEYSEKGLLLHEQAYGKDHPQVGFMCEQLAGVYLEAERFDDAIRYYNKAIIARSRITDSHSRNDIALLYSSIGTVCLRQQKYDSAMANMQRALAIESSSVEKNIPQRSLIQQRFGDLYFQRKQYDSALYHYHSASLSLTQAIGNEDVYLVPPHDKNIYKKELLEVIQRKARTFEMLYHRSKNNKDLRSALSHYREAMNVLDGARREYSSDASKFYLSGVSSSVYRNGCRIALKLYEKTNDVQYTEEAFLIADRSKGNILLEKLFDGEAKKFAGIPDSLLNVERELLNSITQYESQLSRIGDNTSANDDVLRSVIQAKHFTARQQLHDLIDLLEVRYPKYFELKYSRYSLSLKEIQDHLEPNTTLIEYLIDDNVIYAFSVSRSSFNVRTLKNSEQIGSLARRFSSSLKTYNPESFCETGYALYAALILPLGLEKNFSSSATLKVIPDGFLHYIPFEALPVKKYSGGSIDFSRVDYIVSRYDVSYSYSAAFDLRMRGQVELTGQGISSFAGFAPVFKDSTKNGDFFANRSSVEESGISDVRSITLDGKTFNELKYSENEVVSIGNMFAGNASPVKNFLHTSATEKNFKEFAPEYDVIHIATHGFFNENNPKLSAVLFSQPKEISDDEDGILYVDETFNLNLKAQLVVLSSCESGVGKLVEGEGMIALSRGLFYAGAKNIIYSLWKVSDKQTYLLMDEFYRNVVAGRSYSSALRSAKLSLISSKESAFPSKWSGFVLIGK